MSRENPLWGALQIHGELLMLGIEVAQSTVGRYNVLAPPATRPFQSPNIMRGQIASQSVPRWCL
jgi:hypothetical protein